MATKKKPTAKAEGKQVAMPAPAPDPERSGMLAALEMRPSFNAAAVMVKHGAAVSGNDDTAALMARLADDVKDVLAGDMKRAEAMLFGQAHALQSIFVSLARRSAAQEYLKQWEAYMRMALKAQNQCRMTLETLATIKNPPVLFARQANIAHGPQQVNNGAAPPGEAQPSRAANATTAPSGLLEANDGERLDFRAAGAAGGADPTVAPLGEVNRPANR